jgi:hypothetical protein
VQLLLFLLMLVTAVVECFLPMTDLSPQTSTLLTSTWPPEPPPLLADNQLLSLSLWCWALDTSTMPLHNRILAVLAGRDILPVKTKVSRVGRCLRVFRSAHSCRILVSIRPKKTSNISCNNKWFYDM